MDCYTILAGERAYLGDLDDTRRPREEQLFGGDSASPILERGHMQPHELGWVARWKCCGEATWLQAGNLRIPLQAEHRFRLKPNTLVTSWRNRKLAVAKRRMDLARHCSRQHELDERGGGALQENVHAKDQGDLPAVRRRAVGPRDWAAVGISNSTVSDALSCLAAAGLSSSDVGPMTEAELEQRL